MDAVTFRCPLCETVTFESKEALILHLANKLSNLSCSVCHRKVSSVEQLVEHLNNDGCQPTPSAYYENLDEHHEVENIEQGSNLELPNIESFTSEVNSQINQMVSNDAKPVFETDSGKYYVELLNKENFNIVDTYVDGSLVIYSNDNPTAKVVTKQNSDGTISLTTVNDPEKATQEIVEDTSPSSEDPVEDIVEEIYSCNTCGVSFTSVLDHIQNYHNNEDVVVEDPFGHQLNAVDSQTPDETTVQAKRMISESGDYIFETILGDSFSKAEDEKAQQDGQKTQKKLEFDSIVVKKKAPPNKNGPYHQVMVEEREDGGKHYKCTSCKVSVSVLEAFKRWPCVNPKLECPHCDLVYDNAKSLSAHMKIHKNTNETDEVAREMLDGVLMYKCEICNTLFVSNKSLKLHRRMHDPIKPRSMDPVYGDDSIKDEKYPCTICNKLIPEAYRDIHLKSHANLAELHCNLCNKKFNSKVYLDMHMNIHLAKANEKKANKKIYSCLYCPKKFNRSPDKIKHERMHEEEEQKRANGDVFICNACHTRFPSNKSLQLHKRMHESAKSIESKPDEITSENKYLCTICNKLIPVDYREIHDKSHSDVDEFHCDMCNKKFTSKTYLDMHMSVHVDKVKENSPDKKLPYSCLFCPRKFARPHEKVKHERIHTGEKPHACEVCGKSFRVSYCLTLHMRTHTGARPYECGTCGKRFKAHSVYNHHMLTHSDVRAFKCPFCPKAFKTLVQLAGHKNSHTKPFSCQHCNRRFATLYAVRVHQETHMRQNVLRFVCTMCGASYARTFALKDHLKTEHNQEYSDATGEPQKIEVEELTELVDHS